MDLEPNWSEITAVLGGTFDPPHAGHIELIHGLLENPGIGHIVILPSGNPPLKEDVTSIEHRRTMCELAFKDFDKKKVSLDFLEMNQAEMNPKTKSFSKDSLEQLSEKYSEIAFILGIDQWANLPKWKGFPDIMNRCHWMIVERKPHKKEKAVRILHEFEKQNWLVGVDTTFKLVSTPARELSSTDIRSGKVKSTGIADVDQYIQDQGLFK